MPRGALVALPLILSAVAALGDADHERVKRLHDAGAILSLEAIIDNYRRTHREGRILDSEVEFEHGRYVYELKILGQDGIVREFEYDARTGELLRIEGDD